MSALAILDRADDVLLSTGREDLHALACDLVEVRAEMAELIAECERLRWVACCANLLATHVKGHFAFPSATSPAICVEWADKTQQALGGAA